MATQLSPLRLTTELPPALSTHELLLAVDAAKRVYAQASYMHAEAWRGYEEAIDDGDREAVADFLRLIDLAADEKETARLEMEAAYGRYFAAVN